MPSIQLRTPVPGPKSIALAQRSRKAVARGLAQTIPVFIRKAEGAILEDVDGNRFIDMAGGIGCLNVGHRNPAVMSAIRAQAEQLLHVCFTITPYEGYVRVAEKLNALTPGDFPKKTVLINSGAEAIENAIKIARAYTNRPAIICFEDAFHGRTLLTLGLTSKIHPYKAGFDPFPGNIYRVPYGHTDFEDTFKRIVDPEAVAAILAEPVLGEGGFTASPPGWWKLLREVCDRHKIVLVADEVQSGFGRTGKFFAIEHYGVIPDLVVAAKSLGGGLPMAAVTGRAEIMDTTEPGSLGGTFGGNPLCCAAALAVIEELETGRLLDRASELGQRFTSRVMDWQQRIPMIGEIRGIGAMRAFTLVRPDGSPGPELAKQIAQNAYERGIILLTAGTYGNVIRVLMPLVISDDQMNEALDVIESAVQDAAHTHATTVESESPAGVA